MAMTLNENQYVWRSGDWKKVPQRQPPYNGIEITGFPVYDPEGHFASAGLLIKDFTFDPRGVTSEIEYMTLSDGWMWIPSPDPGSPPDPSRDPMKFTVLGDTRLEHGSSGTLLRIRLSYGLEYLRRDELGFIFEFKTFEKPPYLLY